MRPSGSAVSAPCAKRGPLARRGSRSHQPDGAQPRLVRRCAQREHHAHARRAARISASRKGRQRASSSRVGRLPGGAQRAGGGDPGVRAGAGRRRGSTESRLVREARAVERLVAASRRSSRR